MAFTKTFSTTTPVGTDYASTADDTMRDDKLAIQERLTLEHYFPTSSASTEDTTLATATGRHRAGQMSAVLIGGTAPTSPPNGALWLDTGDGNKLKVYDLPTASWTLYSFAPLPTALTTNGYALYTITNYNTATPGSKPTLVMVEDNSSMYTVGSQTFSAPVTGVYLINLTTTIIFPSASAVASCRYTPIFKFTTPGMVTTTISGAPIGQNWQGTSLVVNSYNGGSGSVYFTQYLTIGTKFSLESYAYTGASTPIATTCVTIPEVVPAATFTSYFNTLSFTLVRAIG